MEDKNVVVIAIGLVAIISIVVFVNYGNYEYSKLSAQAANATYSGLFQQKDLLIKKLAAKLAVKQKELDGLKAQLGNIAEKINSIKTDINAIVPQKANAADAGKGKAAPAKK